MPTKAEQTFAQALALHQRGQLGEAERLGAVLLTKPFSPTKLTARIAGMLGEPPTAPEAAS